MVKLDSFEHEITSWAGVTVHAHRFGGREFRFRSAELGHIHENGTLDIPFPRLIGNFLIRENLAEEHAWVPNSGWTTFRLRGQQDFQHALWLMRLSYLRYELKAAKHAEHLLEEEGNRLRLNLGLHSLLRALIPSISKSPSADSTAQNLETKSITRPFVSRT